MFESVIMRELYPQSKIDIYVQVLQSDGGIQSTMRWSTVSMLSLIIGNKCVCINAATMALIDAGVPIKDFVCACSAGYIEDTPLLGLTIHTVIDVLFIIHVYLCIDLNYLEETAGGPNLTLAILPKSNKIVLVQVLYVQSLYTIMNAFLWCVCV